MSTDDPDPDSTVSPSDGIIDEDLGGGSATDPTDSGSSDSGLSIREMLLSTEPPETPDDYPGTEPRVAHVIIGVKKMIRGAGAPVKEGVPAIQNFAMAGLRFIRTGRTESTDSGDGNDPEDDVDEVDAV